MRLLEVSLIALFILTSGIPAHAYCTAGITAPTSVPLAGTVTGTSRMAGTIMIGPGGPVYLRVRNIGDTSASFGLTLRKSGLSITSAYCNKAGLLQPNEEYWVVAEYSGDELEKRDVDVFTGVTDAVLELAVFKDPNAFSKTVSDTITIRVRAFIPNTFTADAGYIRPVPGKPGETMIPGPLPEFVAKVPVESIAAAKDCYLTDNRGFKDDAKADSKGWTEFQISIYYGQLTIRPPTGELANHVGISTRVNCATGAVMAQKAGSIAFPFGITALGHPSVAGDKVQIAGQLAVGNPHVFGAPMIDYSFDFTYDVSSKQLTYGITVGAFPAFEGYAIRGNGTPKTILQISPSSKSAWGLVDGGLGLNTAQYSGVIQL